MNIKSLVPIEWSNKLVLTTAQLAHFYGCEPRNISDNFKRNESRFVEGKHHFRLEGEVLKQFKAILVTESGLVNGDYSALSGLVGLRAPSLYLWTERGAARHTKMLSTDKAWEVFEELEDFYFNRNSSIIAPVVTKPAEEKPDLARVYVFQLSDDSVIIVKIGHSKNIRARVAKIERETDLNVVDMYFTPFMPRKDARLVEWASQKKLSSWRVRGEFFSVEFSEARKAIDYFVELVTATLSIESAKLIADKKF